MNRRRVSLAGALLAVTIATLVVPPALAQSAQTCDWRMYGHDIGHSFAQREGCSELSSLTATTIHPKWVFHTPDAVSASPTIVGDRLYVGDWAGNFYSFATDPPAGPVQPKWTFHVDDGNNVGFGRIVSTAAAAMVGGQQLILFAGGATLYALDTDGHERARICLDPRADPAVRCTTSERDIEVESSPAVFPIANGVEVMVGLDVHNDANVGRTGVVAMTLQRTKNGALAFTPKWKFDPEAGVAYHGPDLLTRGSGTGNGCGGVWSSPAVDRNANKVFFGTASCSVDGITTGERMWSVRLDNGALVWSYAPPRISTRWDDDFGSSPNVLPGGMVGEGSKDGWYYAVDEGRDPATGGPHVRWATQVGEPGHATEDFAIGGVLGTPAVGTVNGEPAIFITTAISLPNEQPLDSGPSLDRSVVDEPQRMLSLHAVRVSDGKVLWRQPVSRQSYGAPTVANDVVLVPSTFDFSLDLFAADTGLPLGQLPLFGAPASAPVSVGNSVYLGVGTGEGEGSPLAPLSGVAAFVVGAGVG